MSDKHTDDHNVLDDANPFRTLNKKKFPQKNQPHPATTANKSFKEARAGKHKATAAASQPDDAGDMSLFLQAVDGTNRLKQDDSPLSQHELRGLVPPTQKTQRDHPLSPHKQALLERSKAELPDDDADLFNTMFNQLETNGPGSSKKSGRAGVVQPSTAKMLHAALDSGKRGSQPHAQLDQALTEIAMAQDDDSDSQFADVMLGVAPLPGKGRDVLPEPAPKTSPVAPCNDALRDFLEGKLEFALHHSNEYAEGHVIGLDPAVIGKLQNGQFSPEGHLDLHGLNALQAYHRLIGFMRNAYLRNHRTVLLVPGRGLNSPQGIPVLRERVQAWLTQEPLRRVVLAFCTAQAHDGGSGALYVLLRKFRKDQGKVQWDRTPVDPDLLL